MKKLFLSLFVFLVALTIGCQESSITNPPVPDGTQRQGNALNLANDDIKKPDNIIDLKYELVDPKRQVQSELVGQVQYNIQILPNINDIRYFQVKVGLKMFSQLRHLVDKDLSIWEIKGKSEDKLFIAKTGWTPNYLRKTYKVSNRSDIVLSVTYEVRRKVIKVKDVKLYASKNLIFDVR